MGLTVEGQISPSAEVACNFRECGWGLEAARKEESKKENRMTSSSFYMCSTIWRACVSDLTIFVEEENVSCLSRVAGSPRSRGGRVAQPTSGSVEADSPHLHQTAALFWHGSKSWPWWSLMSGGMRKNRVSITICCSLVPLQFERSSGCVLRQLLLV